MIEKKIPKGTLTEKQLRKLLKDKMGEQSATEWGGEHEITAQQITAFMRASLSPGLKIPMKLGYFPQTVYVPIKGPRISTANPPRRVAKNPTAKVDHTREPVEKKGWVKPDKKKELKKRKKKKR